MWVGLRKETLLNLAGYFDLAGDAFALSYFRGEVLEEFGVFESEAGLSGYGLEELAIRFGVGLLGTLGAEGDDSGETVAAGERDEEFSREVGEGGALGIGGVDQPTGGIVAVDVGRDLGAGEGGDRGGGGGEREGLGCAWSQWDADSELQTEGVTAAKEDSDAIDVEGFAQAVSDGVDEGRDFGKVAGFVGELGEELLGGVGLAEEALVNLLLEAPGDDEAEGKEQGDDNQDVDDVGLAILGGAAEEKAEVVGHPGGQQDGDDDERTAGEEVFGALADEDAEIQSPLDDDDVGKREREEEEDSQR